MARLPYANLDAPSTQDLVQRITKERGKVFNLYAMLLNSPSIAEGWLAFLTAVRQKASLSGRIRELLIMRVAVLNRADYEFAQHLPFALRDGFTEQQMEDLKDDKFDSFSDKEKAAIAYCDEMTRNIRVQESTFQALKSHFNTQELVEITATVGAYNLVSRFLEAIEIDHD